MDPTSQFLNQGLLGVIIVVLASALATMFWLLIREKDKRAQDYVTLIQVIMPALKDLSTAQALLQKSFDSIVTILDRIKWKEK